ncbi:MAG: YabP/YqfC family sporulation protein [Clostridia bacterium]|nr:YabP/YqfC family sporulation protein [Clostridia bacterium]MBQ8447205.1 YabP/YqfC family sporulation protein [Clostridia bacterium]
MQETNKHSVLIEQRKTITVNGVESVVAFSEVKIILTLFGGGRMSVVGTGLKISGFSKSSGTFTAEGSVTGISYGGKNFAARIFK